MFNRRQKQEQSQQQQQQQSVGPRRGMTPRMLELSRRLSDIEFKEYIPTAPPVVSPSAFSRQGGRKRGSIAEMLSAQIPRQAVPQTASPQMVSAQFMAPSPRMVSRHTASPQMVPPPTDVFLPEAFPPMTSPSVMSPRTARPQVMSPRTTRPQMMSPRAMSPRAMSPRAMSPQAMSPRAMAPLQPTLFPRVASPAMIASVISEEGDDELGDAAAGSQLRERLRVPISEPSRLGGLELVEPAKVDTMYAEDRETSEYRQRRRARESIGSTDGFGAEMVGRRAAAPYGGQPVGGVRQAHGDERPSEGRRRLVALTRRIHEDWDEVSTSLRELRTLVATSGGLPVGAASRLRTTLWLAMLEVREIGVEGYARALGCCPSASADKIDNDAFRTLAGDAEFRRTVPTVSVVRVLNALVSAPDRLASDPPRYVQGMNTLVAPFLYVMGESAGFYAFRQFLRKECPLYARPSLPGVHACVQLVDECLAVVDPRLFSHLKRHGAVAKIYAFPAAMTLSASVGPLRQVVRLWDFLLAFGVHLNVVCIVAQLLSMRELLLTTRSPMAFLRSWPPLRAESVIRRTREIYDMLPERLRRCIKYHAHDPDLAERLASAPQVPDPVAEPAAWALQHRVVSPLGPAPPAAPSGAPAGLQLSLKRDLPLSPDAAAVCCSSPTSRSSSTASRPRARTFSGMVKRPRTDGRPLPELPPVGLPVSSIARSPPAYGSIGLGIRPPAHQLQDPFAQQRASSSSSITRKTTRALRMATGTDARWTPDRKLSAEYREAQH